MLIRYVALVALLAAGGCPAPVAPPSEFELNRAKWQAAGLDSYEFDYSLGCECLPEATRKVHVVVEAGQIIELRYVEDGSPADPAYFIDVTIDGLFADLERAQANGAAYAAATYDPELGYPARAGIDYELGIADDEFNFSVENLTAR
jgi:hypothetical protein